LFQRFTVVVNNMRANVDVLPYDDHDRAVKLLHSLDRTIWAGKFEAIVESEEYDTLTVNELFSKLKSAEVDRGMTAKLEGPTDSHSLALVGGSNGKTNTNPSTRMFSLSSLMFMPDEEFDVLGENIPEPPKIHHKNDFPPKPNHLRNRLDTTPAPPMFPTPQMIYKSLSSL
jgi:hypothetical protein